MKTVVMLDFGHEETVAGKHSPDKSFFEWKFNRDLGMRIYNRLKGMGVDVRIINPETSYVSLSERCRRCNAVCAQVGSKNVIFVSIHANAAGNASQWMKARGWSVWVSKKCSQDSKELAGMLFDAAKREGFQTRQPLPGQKYWQENFTVVTKTNCPAVLTESLFYDNKEDLAILQSADGMQRLVNLHCDAIMKYITSKCKC